jgi:hypothetical protein
MNIDQQLFEIARSLGRIEGRLDEINSLPMRVTMLERWQSWLKGGFAVLAAACAFIALIVLGK